ncbi:MAG: helix-hairpin-helix domain-containing protein [Methanoculleus sp.]
MYLLDRFLADHRDELWMEIPWDAGAEFDRSLKTALLLSDWADEVGEDTICERYNVGPGDIYGMVEGIAWLIHASRHLARLFAPHLAGPIEEMELRAKYGIRRELLPLIRLRGIGRVRARRLFNNAMGSVEALRAAGPEKVGRVIGEKIAAQVFEQLEGMRDEIEGEIADEQVSLSRFG